MVPLAKPIGISRPSGATQRSETSKAVAADRIVDHVGAAPAGQLQHPARRSSVR